MGYNEELKQLGKSQRQLLDELHMRGYPKLYQQQLSSYLNGVNRGPQSVAVLNLTRDIIDEWKTGKKAAV